MKQKNQSIELSEHSERYFFALLLFGFYSANYAIKFIKTCLLPNLVTELDIEPTVIKKTNQFIWFKFGDIRLLDIRDFLGRTTSLESFLKA